MRNINRFRFPDLLWWHMGFRDTATGGHTTCNPSWFVALEEVCPIQLRSSGHLPKVPAYWFHRSRWGGSDWAPQKWLALCFSASARSFHFLPKSAKSKRHGLMATGEAGERCERSPPQPQMKHVDSPDLKGSSLASSQWHIAGSILASESPQTNDFHSEMGSMCMPFWIGCFSSLSASWCSKYHRIR